MAKPEDAVWWIKISLSSGCGYQLWPRFLSGVFIRVMEKRANMQSQGFSLRMTTSIYQCLLYPEQRGNNTSKMERKRGRGGHFPSHFFSVKWLQSRVGQTGASIFDKSFMLDAHGADSFSGVHFKMKMTEVDMTGGEERAKAKLVLETGWRCLCVISIWTHSQPRSSSLHTSLHTACE